MSGINLVASDLVASSDALSTVRDRLETLRSNGSSALTSYGANPLALGDVVTHGAYVQTKEEVIAYTQWILKSWQHAEHIANKPELFLDLIKNKKERVSVRYAGLQSVWTMNNSIKEIVFVKREVMDKVMSAVATQVTDGSNYDYGVHAGRLLWVFNEPKLHDSYMANSNEPLLSRALWQAKREALIGATNNGWTGVKVVEPMYAHAGKLLFQCVGQSTGIDIERFISAQAVVDTYFTFKSDPRMVRVYRDRVLDLQTASMRNEELMRRQIAAKNFGEFWNQVKQRQRSNQPTVEQGAEAWETIPLQEAGIESSRSWGIEVETVRAQRTSRPSGWKQVYDGSLESDFNCDCECHYCYDGEHDSCSFDDGSCEYDGDGCAEFVSPVLQHFNSNGLRQLCNDLPTEEYNSSPGIHVHVGASDLTVSDVARLLYAYSVAAPLLESVYHRQSYGYCHEMQSNNIQYWLSAVRTQLRDTGSIPEPSDVAQSQPADRYQDVNVHALFKHGTIEFRSMGPRYDYNHLVRWAWFCREMVNVSKLGLDNSVWLKCRTLQDIITVLRTYGKESYTSSLPINSNDLVLVEN